MFCVSDEGDDNEPGEARQTAGAGPHRRQGELEYMLINNLQIYLFFPRESHPWVVRSYIIAHCCAL